MLFRIAPLPSRIFDINLFPDVRYSMNFCHDVCYALFSYPLHLILQDLFKSGICQYSRLYFLHDIRYSGRLILSDTRHHTLNALYYIPLRQCLSGQRFSRVLRMAIPRQTFNPKSPIFNTIAPIYRRSVSASLVTSYHRLYLPRGELGRNRYQLWCNH